MSQKKMSHSSAEHGAVTHEEVTGTVLKSIQAVLEGWWMKGAERTAFRTFRFVSKASSSATKPRFLLKWGLLLTYTVDL